MKTFCCPTCARPVSDKQREGKPFCGERCRLIDLGAWLGGGYRIPSDESIPQEPGSDHSSGSGE